MVSFAERFFRGDRGFYRIGGSSLLSKMGDRYMWMGFLSPFLFLRP